MYYQKGMDFLSQRDVIVGATKRWRKTRKQIAKLRKAQRKALKAENGEAAATNPKTDAADEQPPPQKKAHIDIKQEQ